MKNKNIIISFQHALSGIIWAIKTEKNMRIHFCMMVMVILFGFILHIHLLEWIICIILFGLVIAAECFNTSVEKIVDLCSPNYNQLAKIAKDLSAGAVLIFAIISVIVGLIIFLPKVVKLF